MEIVKLILGLIIGLVSGHIIAKLSKKFVYETDERIREYNLDKKILITATVSFTVAVLFKLNWIGFLQYGIVGLLLILIGTIDYYTHYVYVVISFPAIIFSIIIGIYFNGIHVLAIQIPLYIILAIIAYCTSKFYGDIEAMIIIGYVSGILGLMIITALSLIFAIPELFKNRNDKKYTVAFCMYLAMAYIASIILII